MEGVILKKRQLIQSFQNFPDEVNSEDAIERILLLAQIERSLQQIEEGKVITHDQMLLKIAEMREHKRAETRPLG